MYLTLIMVIYPNVTLQVDQFRQNIFCLRWNTCNVTQIFMFIAGLYCGVSAYACPSQEEESEVITKDAETEAEFVDVKSDVSDVILPEMGIENREVNVEPELEKDKNSDSESQAEPREVETEITEVVSRSREMNIDEIELENKEIEKIDEVEPPTFSHRHTNVD